MDLFGMSHSTTPAMTGAQYQLGYLASVVGILGRNAPPVRARGSGFSNQDRWTSRFLLNYMCAWAKENPKQIPTKHDVAAWVTAANKEEVAESDKCIQIATAPEVLSLRVALGLTGGAYHEALHSKYSSTRNLLVAEVADIVLPRWAQIPDWSPHLALLLDWWNYIEDIRIERLGCAEYEAIRVKMCDLQDLILIQEAEGWEKQRVLNPNFKPSMSTLVCSIFRDYGLGYNTAIQREALEHYQEFSPEAMAFVLDGPLREPLAEAIGLTESDDLGSLRVAMDVLIKVVEHLPPPPQAQGASGVSQDQQKGEQAQQGQPGDGDQKCPSCKAPAKKLIVRPLIRNGIVAPGMGVVTCTVCGYQAAVPLKEPDKDAGPATGQGPKFEGFPQKEKEESSKGAGGVQGEDKKEEGTGKGGGGDKKEDKKEEDKKEAAGTESRGAEEKPKDEALKGEKKDGVAPEKNKPTGDNSGGSKAEVQPEKTDDGSSGEKGDEADGTLPEEVPTKDWSNIAQQLLDSKINGMLDSASALGASFEETKNRETGTLPQDEALWMPYSTEKDQVAVVGYTAKSGGREHDEEVADLLLAEVKEDTAFLMSRFRTILRTLEQTRTTHGAPRGRRLDPRFLVDTVASLRGGVEPRRAFLTKGSQLDLTMAAVVLLDQSGSMNPLSTVATKILLSLTVPLEGNHIPTMVLGFRDGNYLFDKKGIQEKLPYHRYNSINYDIFKGWNERFPAVRGRFTRTRSKGMTPMSDGIQYSLLALAQRKETHRFLFVVTDGKPDTKHRPVVNRQLRLAKKAGIQVIGVGMGVEAEKVVSLYPDSVWTTDPKKFPHLLLEKINEIILAKLFGR